MSRSLARCVLLSAATLLAGCPDTDKNFQLIFKFIQAPATSGGQACGAISASSTTLPENKYTLRLTFLERLREESGGISKEKEATPASLRDFKLICQRVIPRNNDVALVVPVGERQAGDPISVVVEAYDKAGSLFYVGRRDDIDLTSDKIDDRTIYLRQTIARNPTSASAGFSCMQETRERRAFHSATLLPNGQVLIFGGLVAGSNSSVFKLNTSETAHATGDVEVYDPSTLKFLLPSISGTAPRPRGFHVAQLLPSPARGPYRILLLGGVMPPAADQPAFRLKRSTSDPFLVGPHEKALAAPAAVLTYTPSPMKISYEELPNLLPQMMFPAAALAHPSTALVVAGGAASTTNLHINTDPSRGFSGAKSASWFSLSSSAAPAVNNPPVPMNNIRVGHTLARLGAVGAGRHVVVGGNMNGNKNDAIEIHNQGESNFTQAAIAPKPCTTDAECDTGFKCDLNKLVCPGRASTVWHTLTPIGGSDQKVLGTSPTLPTAALWAGGYTLAEEVANLRLAENTPQPAALQLIRSGPPLSVSLISPAASGGFTSVGYHHAIRLYDGSVMLTGGNLATCNPTSPFCGSNQLVIHSLLKSGALAARQGLPSLRVSRFGHRTTRLLDNTILITGGITVVVKGTTPEAQLTKVTERFNPRTGDVTEDYPLNRLFIVNDPKANSNPDTTCKLRAEVVE